MRLTIDFNHNAKGDIAWLDTQNDHVLVDLHCHVHIVSLAASIKETVVDNLVRTYPSFCHLVKKH